MYSWNQRVSVRAGINITTVVFGLRDSNAHFSTHSPVSFLPYGGLQNTVCPPQFCLRPSISLVKYKLHLWFSSLAHGSKSKLNSESNSSNKNCGVSQSSLLLENKTLSISYHLNLSLNQ